MKVVIIDYGAGNVFSVTTALQRLGVQAVLSSDVRLIARAERVIFPGVGQAAAAMKQLKDKGLDRSGGRRTADPPGLPTVGAGFRKKKIHGDWVSFLWK